MARARNIKPAFFTNETLVELPFECRLLFIGLWTIADREGRLEDRPKRIKMELFPADSVDVEAGLSLLEQHGFILRYDAGELHAIQVINWHKHQQPHVKEKASTIPAPDKHGASTGLAPCLTGASPSDSLIPDSLNLIPDSLSSGATAPSAFDRFWDAYPKKRSKGDAEKAWGKIKPNELLVARMLRAIEQAKTSADWTKDNGQFIPYPASWLNSKGWEDDTGEQPASRRLVV